MQAAHVASLVQYACLLEASAPKPGNVSPAQHFHDMRYEDFLTSAAAIGPAFAQIDSCGLGETVLAATSATRAVVHTNTNLGITLLLAPLAKAAVDPRPGDLRTRTRRVLDESTSADAAAVYAAIRLAAPGGLGHAPREDVQEIPTSTLLQVMQLAAHRDTVAAEYASGFEVTFEIGAPTLSAALEAGLDWNAAIVECALALLTAVPDTLIARKLGAKAAASVQQEAAMVCRVGGVRTAEGRAALERFDARLRDPANRRNPGTTADLVAAACFVVIFGRAYPQ